MTAKTQCIHGHEYTPENTYVTPKGHRRCRTCARLSDRAWRNKRARPRVCDRCGISMPYAGNGCPRSLCDDCWQICPKCDEPNGVDLAKRAKGADRLCKNCRNEYMRDRWARLNKGRGPGSGRPRIPAPYEFILHKTCTVCGESKPWAKFPPRSYHPDGTVRAVTSRCQLCGTKAMMARRRANPKARAKQREVAAEWQRRKRAALAADRTNPGPRLPVGPFRVWLARALEDRENFGQLAEAVGLNERTLRRAIDGSQAHVSLRVADQCFTRTGFHLNDFYPEDEEAAA